MLTMIFMKFGRQYLDCVNNCFAVQNPKMTQHLITAG